MDAYFTDKKIEDLVTDHNWELVPAGGGKYKLRQNDERHMTTQDFAVTPETAHRFCVSDSTSWSPREI